MRSSLKLFTVGQELSDWEENDHNSRIIRVERPTQSAASGHLQETTLICVRMLLDRNVVVKWDYQTGAVDSRVQSPALHKPGIMVHPNNPCTWEVGTEKSEVQSRIPMCSRFKAMKATRPCLNQ